jgi:hypothetical protein
MGITIKQAFTKVERMKMAHESNECVKRDSERNLIAAEYGFAGMKELFAFELAKLGINSFADLKKVNYTINSFRHHCYTKYKLGEVKNKK